MTPERWLKFNAVGAVGILVRAGMLALFVDVLGMHYLLATGLAVEVTVFHNFCFHCKWTWRDRRPGGAEAVIAFLRFNLTNGLISLGGSALVVWIMTGLFGFDPLLAGLAALVPCGLANFFLTDRLVFVRTGLREHVLTLKIPRGDL